MRKIGKEHSDSDYFMNLIQTRSPETIANMVIILIKQADYLLFKQLEAISNNFIENGGFNEKMYKYRKDYRDK
jgi:four helix bundle suffix protein